MEKGGRALLNKSILIIRITYKITIKFRNMCVKYNTDKYNKIKQELGHVYTLFYTHPSIIHPKEYIVQTDKILK